MDCVIDTNVLVYDTLEDSELHGLAAETLDTIDRWLLPSVVIEEFVSVMVKLGVKHDFISRKLSELLRGDAVELVPIEPEDFETAAGLISDEGVTFRRFNDKLLISVAKRRGTPLFTLDKGLDRQRRLLGVDSASGNR